jgi:hypothetical protein
MIMNGEKGIVMGLFKVFTKIYSSILGVSE